MSTLDVAVRIAATAHAGQLDKDGQPYITHPLRVMGRVQGEPAQIVAVLHDVLEDTVTTAEDLRAAGFSEEILAALLCVTHAKDLSYADYVVRIAGNPIARQVKLADLEDNTRLDRTLLRPDRIERDLTRIHRYFLSYRFLSGRLSEADYRRLMAAYGEIDA
jgi:hypothetical protein